MIYVTVTFIGKVTNQHCYTIKDNMSALRFLTDLEDDRKTLDYDYVIITNITRDKPSNADNEF
jgi:hypothetical protein